MGDYFHCEICDKSIKIRSKKRHLNSRYHKSLSACIISKYTVENPSFLHMQDILKKYVDDYNKKFVIYIIICKWKLHFSDIIINVESNRLYNIHRPSWNLRSYLISKIEYLENKGHKFSHISEMNIVFISNLRNMTYRHYLQIPKSMLEWTMIKKMATNPQLIKAFNINTYHPLIRKYRHIINNREIQYFI